MFDLETEIKSWLRQLRKEPGFEEGDIYEIEAHLRDSIDTGLNYGLTEQEAFEKAKALFGSLHTASEEMIKSRSNKRSLPKSRQLQLYHTDSVHPLIQFKVMFLNHLKIGVRNLNRNRLFSSINIFGLAIGMAVCLIISLWVQKETGYDGFHSKADRVFRVERELFRENLYSRWPITSGGYKDALLGDYGEIEHATRIWRRQFVIKDSSNNIYRQELFAADNSIFKIFDFDLEAGDKTTALSEPRSLVLTREKAIQYFGTDDVIGELLNFEWQQGQWAGFKVTGILKDVPDNSHIHFEALMSISSYPESRFDNLRSNYLYTYVLLKEGTDKSVMENELKQFVSARLAPVYGDLTKSGADIHDVLKMELFPIRNIHLDPSPNWEIEAGGNKASVFIFSSISILILLIACLNFINLSTARAGKRATEVGIRKTFGANRRQLRWQFIQESAFSTILATLLAYLLVLGFIPLYNSFFSNALTWTMLLGSSNLIAVFAIALFVGFLSGLYPAFYLTKFRPANVLRGGLSTRKGKSGFRRNIVVAQFVISVFLIIGMFTVYNQMKFIKNKSLGYDQENVIMLSGRSASIAAGFESFRNELVQNPNVLSVSASSRTPVGSGFSNTNFWNDRLDVRQSIQFLWVDYDFIDTYRMEILAGRNFSKDFATDTTGIIILNEAAMEKLGWQPEQALNEYLDYSFGETKIVGLVKNFNFKSIKDEIEPLALLLGPSVNAISVRIEPNDFANTLGFLQETWENSFSGEQFEYTLLDNRIAQLYESEQNMQNLLLVFSSFSIFIACLGLFGLATFTAEVKTKEIGIRKVMGASVKTIVILLSRDVVKWILLANAIAWPMAWYIMNQWLENFAYRVELSWNLFFGALVVTLLISVSTFSIQAIRAAVTNPVKSLRNE